MDFLLDKLVKSILNAVNEIFSWFVNIFIGNPTILDVTKYKNVTLIIASVAAVILFMSVIRDLLSRASGMEGSLAEVNIGEYIVKIIFSIFLIALLPQVLQIFAYYGSDVLLDFTKSVVQDFNITEMNNFMGATVSSIAMMIVLIVVIVTGIGAMFQVVKTQVEIGLMILFAPLTAADSWKSLDKVSAFISKFIGLHLSLAIRIFLINLGLYQLKALLIAPVTETTSSGAQLIILSFAAFVVAKEPVSVADLMTTPTNYRGGNIMQKAYYGRQIATSFQKLYASKGSGKKS